MSIYKQNPKNIKPSDVGYRTIELIGLDGKQISMRYPCAYVEQHGLSVSSRKLSDLVVCGFRVVGDNSDYSAEFRTAPILVEKENQINLDPGSVFVLESL